MQSLEPRSRNVTVTGMESDPTGAMRADVIVVLGAAFRSDGTVSPALLRRLERGLALYRAGAAPRLLLTGGAPGEDADTRSEADAMAEFARATGVPEVDLVLEPEARNTRQNAAKAAAIMARQGWGRALLVTDSFHMPRARLLFRARGVEVISAPAADAPKRLWPWLREAGALARDLSVVLAWRTLSRPGPAPSTPRPGPPSSR